MASNHTEKYQLNQWDADDKVIRTDFNEDNAKIEAALAGLEQSKASAVLCDGLVDALHNTNVTVQNLVTRVTALEQK